MPKTVETSHPQQSRTPTRVIVYRVCGIALGLLAAGVAVEIVFRIAGINGSYLPAHQHQFLRQPDGPQMMAFGGFVPLATHRTDYRTDPRGYFAPGTIVDHKMNSAGWRDQEHSMVKPPGVYRMLALGDSYLMGQGVHFSDTFFSLVASRLNSEGFEQKIEMISTGLSGHNTSDELEVLRRRGFSYDPDLVIVHFVPNDVEDDLSRRGPLIEFYRNYTSITLEPDLLSRYSRVWSWGRQRFVTTVTARRYVQQCLADFRAHGERWQNCRDALRQIVDACRSRKVHVAVVVFPFYHELNGDYPFQPIHDLVGEFCRDADVPCLDLRESYRDYAGPELWVHPTDQHPNEIAHQIASEAIADFLIARRDALEIDRRPPPRFREDQESRLKALALIDQLGGSLAASGDVLSFENVANLTDFDLALMEPYWSELGPLRAVSLSGTNITGGVLQVMGGFEHLVGFDVSRTRINRERLSQLAAWNHLEQLGLDQLPVDRALLVSLAKLPRLKLLSLNKTPLGDADVDSLLALDSLETLHIAGTSITAKGIRSLAEHPRLLQLTVAENQLSEAERQALQATTPRLDLVRQQN